jgi:hypothetical protein
VHPGDPIGEPLELPREEYLQGSTIRTTNALANILIATAVAQNKISDRFMALSL